MSRRSTSRRALFFAQDGFSKRCDAENNASETGPVDEKPADAKLAIFANTGYAERKEIIPVPTRNVNLTDELDRFISTKIESGRYENASEVVRAALRSLERDEQQFEARLASLRVAIDEGDASGLAGDGVFAQVRHSLNLSR